jgi:glycosyltransferase involved in cell wall biosynthesis
MMHILLIHQAFAAINEPGGTRHHELALFLARNGHQVTIVASPVSYLTGKSEGGESNQSGHKNIRIIRPPVYQALHRSFVHRVLNFISFMVSSFMAGLKVKNIDLVWGTSPPIFQGVTAVVLARLKRVPFLFEIRDLWPAFAIDVGVLKNSVLIRASEWLERFLYKNADVLMVNSPGFVEHVQARGAKQIKLVPNGSDVRMFHPSATGLDFRREHGLEGKFIVLYAGAHGMSNDLDIVLDAAANLQDFQNLAIVLLGDGKEKKNLMTRAVEIGLQNIHFISSVPKDEMGAALAASDACIAILKPIEMYKTVYPNKVFDYMAAGRPVILAIDGVIREVVETARAGLIVKPGDAVSLADAIRNLAENPISRIRMGKNGRVYIENHFDRATLAQELMDLMNQMTFNG